MTTTDAPYDSCYHPIPTAEEQEDVLLSSRYGELEQVQQFVDMFGIDALKDVRDEDGNTVLHMVCANGHEDILTYLLSYTGTGTSSSTSPTTTTTTKRPTILPPALLTSHNTSAHSTPLHWAALNAHLGLAKLLVGWPHGPGTELIEIKNAAGRTPAGEAEASGWEEGAMWFASVRRIDSAMVKEEGEGEAETGSGTETKTKTGVAKGRDAGNGNERGGVKTETEVPDAVGRMREMSLEG